MVAHYYYKPLPKNTINFKDITSNAQNRTILHELKQNKYSYPLFDKLCISNGDDSPDLWRGVYVPGEEEDVSWLGKFLGTNSYVKELVVKTTIDDSFYKELSCNKSIKKIDIRFIDLSDGQIFYMLDPFKRNQNNNLNHISVNNCTLGTEGALQLSIAIGNFNNKSLKQITLSHNRIGEGQMNNVITALGMQTELETLILKGMNIGRTECASLSTMIRWGITKLRHLSLFQNNIDDESVKSLVDTFSISKLVFLSLSDNQLITLEGYKTLSTLLERSDSSLEKLFLHDNNIDSMTLAVFANALTNNSALKILGLFGNTITDDGWLPFSKLLCDTTSVNRTYISNHTLESIGNEFRPVIDNTGGEVPVDIVSSLALNRRSIDKGQVAMEKVLQHHSHINVQSFFEWELKVLPLLVTWFSKALAIGFDIELYNQVRVMKLNAIYDFVREMPMLVGCSNIDRNGKKRSGRHLESRMSTFDNPDDSTVCNCSCVIS